MLKVSGWWWRMVFVMGVFLLLECDGLEVNHTTEEIVDVVQQFSNSINTLYENTTKSCSELKVIAHRMKQVALKGVENISDSNLFRQERVRSLDRRMKDIKDEILQLYKRLVQDADQIGEIKNDTAKLPAKMSQLKLDIHEDKLNSTVRESDLVSQYNALDREVKEFQRILAERERFEQLKYLPRKCIEDIRNGDIEGATLSLNLIESSENISFVVRGVIDRRNRSGFETLMECQKGVNETWKALTLLKEVVNLLDEDNPTELAELIDVAYHMNRRIKDEQKPDVKVVTQLVSLNETFVNRTLKLFESHKEHTNELLVILDKIFVYDEDMFERILRATVRNAKTNGVDRIEALTSLAARLNVLEEKVTGYNVIVREMKEQGVILDTTMVKIFGNLKQIQSQNTTEIQKSRINEKLEALKDFVKGAHILDYVRELSVEKLQHCALNESCFHNATVQRYIDELYGSDPEYLADIVGRIFRMSYRKVDTKTLIHRCHGLGLTGVYIFCYKSVFEQMEGHGDLDDESLFKLAVGIKDIAGYSSYASVSTGIKAMLEDLKTRMPDCIRNAVFEETVCIKNTLYDEFMYGSRNLSSANSQLRHVFTWVPSERMRGDLWTIAANVRDNAKAIISNAHYKGEPLLLDEPDYSIYTWTAKDDQSNGEYWTIESAADKCYLKSNKQQLYLRVGSELFTNNQRKVYLRSGKHKEALWQIQGCR